MSVSDAVPNIQIPICVWIEFNHNEDDACDVLVKMEDGTIFTALFVTPNYLNRQMDLTYDLSKQVPDAVPVRLAVLDTPHIAVDDLDRECIEDAIDNLLAMDIFESVFTQVTENPAAVAAVAESDTTTNSHRATQEVAAVVLSDVLVVEEN
jgi:hypothetical protein